MRMCTHANMRAVRVSGATELKIAGWGRGGARGLCDPPHKMNDGPPHKMNYDPPHKMNDGVPYRKAKLTLSSGVPAAWMARRWQL